jgi:RNA polymerase sigma-70 factor
MSILENPAREPASDVGIPMRIDAVVIDRLYQKANAERWGLAREVFGSALGMSASRSCSGETPGSPAVERYLSSLHLEDLALACACAEGHERAWEHFVREFRPSLYRAADALEPGGGARDLADSLYGDLYGLTEGAGKRRSLFRYFHGRSSLATWLRAVLSQRYVDRVRAGRRMEPLPDEEDVVAHRVSPTLPDPDESRFLQLVRLALARAVAGLEARDRLRLRCYYAEELTLADTGRLLREHEATVSRHLARTRRTIRERVEGQLRDEVGLNVDQISRCFELVSADAGSLDLTQMLEEVGQRKESEPDRST